MEVIGMHVLKGLGFKPFLSALLFLFFCVPAVWASSSDLPEFIGAEMLVTSQRLPGVMTLTRNYPGNVTILNAEDITASGASNIPDLLSRYEGLTISDSLGFLL